MKNIIKTTLATGLLTFAYSPLYAGAGHDHSHDHGHDHAQKELSKDLAQKKANEKIKQLVEIKKIEKSWLKAPVLASNKKKFSGHLEWVISYKNESIKESKKQVLYIFVNMHGKITGSNYSGK
jgi:hypothetical protein